MKTALAASVVFIVYAYFGYPLLLAIVGAVRSRPIRKADVTSTVSVVIAVHNEERRIGEKIENTLLQTYDRRRMEIIVASDGSTDRTDDIVRSFAGQGVRLVRVADQEGKENAQRAAIAFARGEILVFSDAGTTLPDDAIGRIVRNFADPSVGCVSSVDRLMDRGGGISGEGAYVRYEMLLRRLETQVNSVVGLSGSFFAVRREVCADLAVDVPSDFGTLLNAVRMGLRGVSDPESVAFYKGLADESREFERKVRTVLRGIAALATHRELLNPIRYGMFAWQIWSHKVCRWLVPFAMMAAFSANAALLREAWYQGLFGCQVAFYVAAAWGNAGGWRHMRWVVRIPAFVVMSNVSIVAAWCRYALGQRMLTWTPSER